MKNLFRGVVWLVVLFFYSATLVAQIEAGKPVAGKGLLDLRNTDLRNDMAPLQGQWNFYWKKLVNPAQSLPAPDIYVHNPAIWSSIKIDNKTLESKGYATYALTVLLAKDRPSLSLAVPDAFSSYELFLNGKSVARNGKPDSSDLAAVPFWTTQLVGIPSNTDTLNFVLHVANFWHSKGGTYKDIVIGERTGILLNYRREAAIDLVLAGCLFMGGLFFLGLFLCGKKDKAILFFSLFCIIYSYRMVGTKLYILNTVLPHMNWFLATRLEYLSLVLGVAAFSAYSRCLYPREANKLLMRGVVTFCLAYALLIVFTPPAVFTGLINYFLSVMFLYIVYAFYVYIQAARHGRSGAKYALGSSAVLLLIFLLINLEYFGIIAPKKMIVFFGYIVFFFLQSLVLSRRFAESFRAAAAQAQEGLRAKSEFLSTMSHEIRTPLNSVIGMAHLMQRSSPRPEQKENLDVLLFSANNLLSIVNNILDYNKIEAGKISIEQINMDLPAIARNITAGLKILSEEKRINLELDIDRVINQKVLGDPTRTSQVITNLLHNAIKFTKAGTVKLSLKADKQTEKDITITVSVSDTGIGIAPEKQKLIFERFTQADSSTSRSYGGTGLGLSISKKILELQGTKLELTSIPGKGSSFYFTQLFPLTSEKTEIEQEKSDRILTEINLLSGVNILLVEDNPINVLVAQTFLERCGAIIDIAGNGEEAITLFNGKKHQLVLMDLEMPVLDGYEATRVLRQRGESVPIIALTASLPKEVESDVYSAGLTDIIVKPFNPEDLFRVILSHIKATAA